MVDNVSLFCGELVLRTLVQALKLSSAKTWAQYHYKSEEYTEEKIKAWFDIYQLTISPKGWCYCGKKCVDILD